MSVNGGIAGDDVPIIEKSDQTLDVRGIDNHQIVDIPIITAGGAVKTQHAPAIVIMYQYAYTGQARQFTPLPSWNGTKMMLMTSP